MKKEVKGFICGVLMTSVLLFGVPTFAGGIYKSINASINSVKIALNGKVVAVNNLSYNGRTYVQLAQFCDLLGKATKWDGKTKTVNVIDEGISSPEGIIHTPTPAPTPQSTPTNDSIKPTVLSVNSLPSGTKVEVLFNEILDKDSAENISNYSFMFATGKHSMVPILSADLDSSGTKVILQTEGQQAATLYKLIVSNIKDCSGNIMDEYSIKIAGNKSDKPYLDTINEPLILVSAKSDSVDSVKLTFNKYLDKESAQNPDNYSVFKLYGDKEYLNIKNAELCPEQNKVLLTFSKPAVDGIIYHVKVSGLKDEYGNIIENTKITDELGNTNNTAEKAFAIMKKN